jgi:hypothetical protein
LKTFAALLERTGLALAVTFAVGCNANHVIGVFDAGQNDGSQSPTSDADATAEVRGTDGIADRAVDAAPQDADGANDDADVAGEVRGPDGIADRAVDVGPQDADGPSDADTVERPNQVMCQCLDSTKFLFCGSSCAPSDLQVACQGKCDSHGGIGVTECVMRPPACAPLASSLELDCLCGDGTEVRSCSTIECASPTNMAAGCARLCTNHGAPTHVSCAARPRCAGSSRVNCWCNGTVGKPPIGVCAATDCSSGPEGDDVCNPVCAPLGGLMAEGCQANDTACQ